MDHANYVHLVQMDKLTPIIFHKEVIYIHIFQYYTEININYQPSQLNFKDSSSEQDCVEG